MKEGLYQGRIPRIHVKEYAKEYAKGISGTEGSRSKKQRKWAGECGDSGRVQKERREELMRRVQIHASKKDIHCEEGENLLEVLLKEGIFLENPCGGRGICGKCKVRIRSGNPALTETEERILSEGEKADGIRLACLVEVTEDLEVELLEKERKHKVLTGGYVPEFQMDTGRSGYGILTDIGTTTVVVALVDLGTGKELAAASMINAQKRFGLDVLTRITYEYEHGEEGIAQLQQAIVASLNGMIGEVCREAQISQEDIVEMVVSANCTMLHMLMGVDARSIGRSPYTPVFKEAKRCPAREVGLQIGKDAILYLLPSVSGYVGADIVAGAYVCGLQKEMEKVLFIDIGTNGEMVLANGGKLWCCSCAAGPALEGMNISAGMRAAEGAIEEVEITEEGVCLRTIGNREPAGICGSGILSVMKELLKHGLVKKSGVFIKKESLEEGDYRYPLLQNNGKKREFVLSKAANILVTQGDVRQIQLAKGAILSGVKALLKAADLEIDQLDQVMIAGQFGAHLPEESLTGTGILPREVKGKLKYVGNSSKTGAYMALLSGTVKEEMENLANRMEYMELAETENYERLFAECMEFSEG